METFSSISSRTPGRTAERDATAAVLDKVGDVLRGMPSLVYGKRPESQRTHPAVTQWLLGMCDAPKAPVVSRMEPRQIARALAASLDDDLASAIATLREVYAFKSNAVRVQEENRWLPGTPTLDAETVTKLRVRVGEYRLTALNGVFISPGSEQTCAPVEVPQECNQYDEVIELAEVAGANEALAQMQIPQLALVVGASSGEDQPHALFGGVRVYIPNVDSAGPLRGYVKYAELPLRPAAFNLCKREGDTSLYVEFDKCPWCGDPGACWPAYYSACHCPPMRMFPTFQGDKSRVVSMAAYRVDDADFISPERSGAWERLGESPVWDPGASVCMSELRDWDRTDGGYKDIEKGYPDEWLIRQWIADQYPDSDYGDVRDYFPDYELMKRVYDKIRRLQHCLRVNRWSASIQHPFRNIRYDADLRISWWEYARGQDIPDRYLGEDRTWVLSGFESMTLATIYYTGCDVWANWSSTKGRWQCQVLVPLVRCSGFGTGRSKIDALFQGIFKAWHHFYRRQENWRSAYVRIVLAYGNADLLRNDLRAVFLGFKRARLPSTTLSNICRKRLSDMGEVVVSEDDMGHYPLVPRTEDERESVCWMGRHTQYRRWKIPKGTITTAAVPKGKKRKVV